MHTYWTHLGVGRVLLIAATFVFVWFHFGPLAFAGTFLLFAIVAAIGIWQMKRLSITIEGNTLRYAGAFKKSVVFTLDQNTKAVYAPRYVDKSFGPGGRLYVYNDQKQYMSIVSYWWPAEDIEHLIGILRAKTSYVEISQSVGYEDIMERYPVVAPFYERSPGKFAAIIALSTVFGILAISLVVFIFRPN